MHPLLKWFLFSFLVSGFISAAVNSGGWELFKKYAMSVEVGGSEPHDQLIHLWVFYLLLAVPLLLGLAALDVYVFGTV